MLLRPSLDKMRLLFLKLPTPPERPPPRSGFRTSVCVWEQTFWGEELREEGGVADVIWERTRENSFSFLCLCNGHVSFYGKYENLFFMVISSLDTPTSPHSFLICQCGPAEEELWVCTPFHMSHMRLFCIYRYSRGREIMMSKGYFTLVEGNLMKKHNVY